MRRVRWYRLWIWIAFGSLLASPAAAVLPGDLDGSGAVDALDEALLQVFYGASLGNPGYDPAADLNGDGTVDHADLGAFGAGFGASGGPVDATPPSLVVSLDDIPDDQNDLLVVPPEGFQITLALDSAGGSAVDVDSLSVTSDQFLGPHAPGVELAPLFSTTPTRAVYEVPPGSDLPLTSHFLTVRISDAAGNEASQVYGFAVRNFAYGPPLENPQIVFLDFGQDRSGGPEVDFVEDLRAFGLSSDAAPAVEATMVGLVSSEIVGRAHGFYGREADGSPGPDAANVFFVGQAPGGTYSRLCVGGASALGATFLGASSLDQNNLLESQDECGSTPNFGVFPAGLDDIWGNNAEFQATFHPLMTSKGGTPVGEDPLDPVITAPGFDPATAGAAELARYAVVANAVDGFAAAVAAVAAHETGHLLGLTAHGPVPGGLYGGTYGSKADHNVTPQGGTPAVNHLMNAGGSFSFDSITGRNGWLPPMFRPLSWAYLRDRIALNTSVTALYPAPSLSAVSPSVVSFPPGQSSVGITIHGTDFLDAPQTVDLITEGDPTPNPLVGITWVDPQTLTASVNKFLVPPAVYDVHLVNADGQEVTLVDGLVVQ